MVRLIIVADVKLLQGVLLSYMVFFLALVPFICLAQSDIKRLVAYSSVSHMIVVPILIVLSTPSCLKPVLMAMFFHGLSSPFLFSIVGRMYYVFSSRMLSFVRGLLLLSPLFALFVITAFLMTLSCPPTPSFLSELLFLTAYLSYSMRFIVSAMVFTMISLVYTLH